MSAGLIDLNTTALARLAAAVAPRFAQTGSGAIVNIASVVGLAPELGMAVYGATKGIAQFATGASEIKFEITSLRLFFRMHEP
jgi:uncharacterized protein